MNKFNKDIEILKTELIKFPKILEGKKCVLELKEADYKWRELDWVGFYFQYKVRKLLADKFFAPGDKYSNIPFDLRGEINWETRVSTINNNSKSKESDKYVILNEEPAILKSIQTYSAHGEIIARCIAEWDDEKRSFQNWKSELHGGKTEYEIKRDKDNGRSYKRKVRVELKQIALIIIQNDNLKSLNLAQQTRNANGERRNPKYTIDLNNLNLFKNYIIEF
jgi:hypothetical protein